MGLFSTLFGKNNNEQVAVAMRDGAFLVDVRTPGEFASGSVQGAVNIPLDTIKNQLVKFKDKKNIIVFCRSGNRSAQAKSVLEQNGFRNVINGGTWQQVKTIADG